MSYPIMKAKLLVPAAMTLFLAGLSFYSISERENQNVPVLEHTGPTIGGRPAARVDSMTVAPSLKKVVTAAAPMKPSRAEREMTLEELTDISPQNIPKGAPCVFEDGKLKCTWCDLVINKATKPPPSWPPQ